MLNVPVPLQPVMPVSTQFPEIVPPLTVPCSVSTLFAPPANIVEMVIWNVPITLPLKFALNANDPVCVVGVLKQFPEVEKLKLETVNDDVPLLWVNDVLKAKAGVPSGFDNAAFQVPLTLPEPLEPPPHALSANPSASNTAQAKCFMATPVLWPNPPPGQKLRRNQEASSLTCHPERVPHPFAFVAKGWASSRFPLGG